jgi:hypothetical protein
MMHTWDQQIMRLQHCVDDLEEQNTKLKDMLTDAVRICDEALAGGEPAPVSSRVANVRRFLLSQSASLRSQCQLLWRSLMLMLNRFPYPTDAILSLPLLFLRERAKGWTTVIVRLAPRHSLSICGERGAERQRLGKGCHFITRLRGRVRFRSSEPPQT